MIVMIWTGGFSVAFDPLDGSSIVDTNFSVGTIFGVWPGEKLIGVTGRDQVAAAMGVYGPRTTYVLALKDYPGTHEFLLLDEGVASTLSSNSQPRQGAIFLSLLWSSHIQSSSCCTLLPCSVVLLYTAEKSGFTTVTGCLNLYISLWKNLFVSFFRKMATCQRDNRGWWRETFLPWKFESHIWQPRLWKGFYFTVSLFYWMEEEEMFR